jgi:hypothetical protein
MNTQISAWADPQGGIPETMRWLTAPALAIALIGSPSTSTMTIGWDAIGASPQTEVLWIEKALSADLSLDVSGFPAVRKYLNCFKQISAESIQQIYDLILHFFPDASISFESYKEGDSLNGLRFVVDLRESSDSDLYHKEVALFNRIEDLPTGHAVLRNSIIDIY